MEEQGGNPTQPLDEVFNGILNDQTLREQFQQHERKEQREAEEQEHEAEISLGSAIYTAFKDQNPNFFGAERAEDLDKLGKEIGMSFGFRTTDFAMPKDYIDHIVTQYQIQSSPEVRRVQPDNKVFKYLVYGFSTTALSDNDIASALIGFSGGSWLDDELEGPRLQKQIAEKVSTLTDPKAKVEAAMTWKKIQQAKAPNPATAAPAQPPVGP